MDTFGPLLVAFSLTPAQVALFGVAVVLTVGLVRLVRGLGAAPRMLPVYSLGIGILLALAIMAIAPGPPIHPIAAALIGLGVGLAASGMWSQGKALSGQ